jgi:hypothetical protein
MRRCLWKEFRERRWWALLWVLAILASSLLGHQQAFCGEHPPLVGPPFAIEWSLLLLLLTPFVGVGAYASEYRQARALFIFSRPVPWQTLLGAKLLFGLIIACVTPLLAALLYRLFGPEAYRPYVTLPHLLQGAWPVMGKLMLLYLLGLGCSPLGGWLAGISLSLGMLVVPWVGMLAFLCMNGAQGLKLYGMGFVFVSQIVGYVLSGLSLARFGLTLDTRSRGRHSTVPMVVCLAVGFIVSWWVTKWWQPVATMSPWQCVETIISPHGAYAVMRLERRLQKGNLFESPQESRAYLVRLADQKRLVQLPLTRMEGEERSQYYFMGEWVTDELLLCWTQEGLYRYTPAHGLTKLAIEPYTDWGQTSPDGHHLLLTRTLPQGPDEERRCEVGLLDLRSGRITPKVLMTVYNDNLIWCSRTEVAHWSGMKQRHIARVLPAGGAQ